MQDCSTYANPPFASLERISVIVRYVVRTECDAKSTRQDLIDWKTTTVRWELAKLSLSVVFEMAFDF